MGASVRVSLGGKQERHTEFWMALALQTKHHCRHVSHLSPRSKMT
jgi:hypothetical protein